MGWIDDYKESINMEKGIIPEEPEVDLVELLNDFQMKREEIHKKKAERFWNIYQYLDSMVAEKVEDKDERFRIVSLFFGGLL